MLKLVRLVEPVGTFANISPEVEAICVQKLGIRPQEISTQILSRDLHADYISTIALIATSIEKFATETVDYKNLKHVK